MCRSISVKNKFYHIHISRTKVGLFPSIVVAEENLVNELTTTVVCLNISTSVYNIWENESKNWNYIGHYVSHVNCLDDISNGFRVLSKLSAEAWSMIETFDTRKSQIVT